MNIWLKKRKTQDALNLLWPALVWGTPGALVASAAAYFAVSLSPTLSFWVVLCGLCVLALTAKSQQHVTRQLKQAFSLLTLCFLLVYFAVFGEAGCSIAALQINLPLLLIALWTGYSAHKQS